MAIQKEHGQYPEAYWMVAKIVCDKPSTTSSARVDVYADATAKQNGDERIASYIYELPDSYAAVSQGGVPAVYGILKADQLSGGIDV